MADGARIDAVHGDITVQQVDAIVNAVNRSLLGGGGFVLFSESIHVAFTHALEAMDR